MQYIATIFRLLLMRRTQLSQSSEKHVDDHPTWCPCLKKQVHLNLLQKTGLRPGFLQLFTLGSRGRSGRPLGLAVDSVFAELSRISEPGWTAWALVTNDLLIGSCVPIWWNGFVEWLELIMSTVPALIGFYFGRLLRSNCFLFKTTSRAKVWSWWRMLN